MIVFATMLVSMLSGTAYAGLTIFMVSRRRGTFEWRLLTFVMGAESVRSLAWFALAVLHPDRYTMLTPEYAVILIAQTVACAALWWLALRINR